MTKRSRVAILCASSTVALGLLMAPGAFAATTAPTGNTTTMSHKTAPKHAKAHKTKTHKSTSNMSTSSTKK